MTQPVAPSGREYFRVGDKVRIALDAEDKKRILYTYGDPDTGKLRFPLDKFRYGLIINLDPPADYIEISHDFSTLDEFRNYSFNYETMGHQINYGSQLCTRGALRQMLPKLSKYDGR